MPKFIAIDIDGTFITLKCEVPARNKSSLDKLLESDVIPFFCTGRPRFSALDVTGYSESQVFNGYPGVYINGAVVYNNKGELLENLFFDQHLFNEIMEILKGIGVLSLVSCMSHDTVYATSKAKEHLISNSIITGNIIEIDTFKDVGMFNINLIMIVNNNPQYLEALKKYEGKLFKVYNIYGAIELLVPGVSKLEGIKTLVDHYNGSIDDVVAIGDGENDVEMLAGIKHSYAVANGSEVAKKAAHFITLNTEEGAVAQVIKDEFNIE